MYNRMEMIKKKPYSCYYQYIDSAFLMQKKLKWRGVLYNLLLIVRDLSAENSGEWLWWRWYHTLLGSLGDCRNAIKSRHHILGIWNGQPQSTMSATSPVHLKLLLWDLRFARRWQASCCLLPYDAVYLHRRFSRSSGLLHLSGQKT